MIIGNGFLAKAFKKKFSKEKKIVIFASGVSNSKEKDKKRFRREIKLLKKFILLEDITLVYFSTCSVSSIIKNSYILHKTKIEKLIRRNFKKYFIFRLPQVIGDTYNLNLFVNYFYYNIKKNIPFELWKNSIRNLIDIRDVLKIVTFFIKEEIRINKTTTIASPYNTKVIWVINVLEKILRNKAIYTKVSSNMAKIRIGKLHYLKFKKKIRINFYKDYYIKILYKYYKNRILRKFHY